jgi:chromosome segregation ATPase
MAIAGPEKTANQSPVDISKDIPRAGKTDETAKNNIAVPAGQAQQSAPVTTASKTEKPETANTSNVLARLDNLLKGLENEIKLLSSQVEEAQNANKPEAKKLEEMLNQLKENYRLVKEQISKENKRISRMKTDIPEMQKALAAQSEAVDKERDELLGDISEVEKQMNALENLAKDKPENKTVIEKKMVQLKVQLEDMMASYEVTQIKYDLAKASAKTLQDEIKNREENIKTLTGKAGNIMSEIKTIQDLMAKLKKIDATTRLYEGKDVRKK